MRMCAFERSHATPARHRTTRCSWLFLVVLIGPANARLFGQTDQTNVSEQIRGLTEALTRTQEQLQESQRQLDEMRAQLAALQRQVVGNADSPDGPARPNSPVSSSSEKTSVSLAAAVQDIRERQAIQETQIATHEQTKVESESRYPVKVTGLLLLNGFVNTKAVDMAATPTVAVGGPGSTGASMRQTLLGLDAVGPHLFGAHSYADLHVDFYGNPASAAATPGYTGSYNMAAGILRLRTAHAGLQWQNDSVSFSLDRPIISPDSPISLTAVAVPALAWSGNLWTWNPQVTVTHDFDLSPSRQIRLQTALIDVADAPLSPLTPPSSNSAEVVPTTAEQSRWPGIEARLALQDSSPTPGKEGSHFGIGGYFAPHESVFLARRFDSWAATLDVHQQLPAKLQFTGSFYRGQALGGLGGDAYKDFVYRMDKDTGGYYSRPLNDAGGWAELSEKLSERFELNAALGIDNAFAGDLRRYAVPGGNLVQNLARNRTYTGNLIYSPSSYLMFSLEYRHLVSSPITGLPAASDIIGMGAGYKF